MSSIDPEDLLQCPYDKSHHIRACRFPYHLVKCRKNFPDIARKLESCPFNARHCIPKAEMMHHIMNCVDKKVIEEEFDEAESSGTFVYGYTNLNKNCIKTSSISAYENSTNIATAIRAPKSFPEQLSSSNIHLGSIPFVQPWRIGTGSKMKESSSVPPESPVSCVFDSDERT
ncbi:gametocyte-specific factor 1-like isoform X3 [Hypanus sabinus]|uniref:gametocyte-specific factor 1-like isoform X3 n=1 Tax=Hypanus sabinus TaxID=79690 RepID=UPI0028C37EF7|nr:gametocyte-specific factor 1-like isoform X3 [Hypanus sabinus]